MGVLFYGSDVGENTKTPYHHGDLRESLLAAAELALAELPLQHVTLREIARRAQVSHAAPKHHFASLGQLLGEVAARGFDHFVESLAKAADRAPSQSPDSRLTATVRAYMRFAAENQAVYGLMFGKREHVVEATPHLTASMLKAWSQLEDLVAAVVGRTRAPYGAVTVWANVHGLAMLRLERKLPPHINPDIAIESLTQSLMAGLKAEL